MILSDVIPIEKEYFFCQNFRIVGFGREKNGSEIRFFFRKSGSIQPNPRFDFLLFVLPVPHSLNPYGFGAV